MRRPSGDGRGGQSAASFYHPPARPADFTPFARFARHKGDQAGIAGTTGAVASAVAEELTSPPRPLSEAERGRRKSEVLRRCASLAEWRVLSRRAAQQAL